MDGGVLLAHEGCLAPARTVMSRGTPPRTEAVSNVNRVPGTTLPRVAPGHRVDGDGPQIFWAYHGVGYGARYHWGSLDSVAEVDVGQGLVWAPLSGTWSLPEQFSRWWRVSSLHHDLLAIDPLTRIEKRQLGDGVALTVRLPVTVVVHDQGPFEKRAVLEATDPIAREQQEVVERVLQKLRLLRSGHKQQIVAESPEGEGIIPPTPWTLTLVWTGGRSNRNGLWFRDLVLQLFDSVEVRELGCYRVQVAEDESKIYAGGWLRNSTGRQVRGVASLLYDWLRHLYPNIPIVHPAQTAEGKLWWAAYCERRCLDPADLRS